MNLIVANWKMNKTLAQTTEFIDKIKQIQIPDNTQVLICPPFTSLKQASELTKDSKIMIAAQNMYFEENGAFTGEISAQMLKDVGCTHVLIGHSERRTYFSETDESVNQKIKTALKNNLTPLLCVGETLEQRENHLTRAVIESRIRKALKDITEQIIISYEPIWAIGTGKTATPDQAEEMNLYIREIIRQIYGKETANSYKILYGGSVKPDNIKELMSKPNINGVLVGGAALDVEKFEKIINYR